MAIHKGAVLLKFCAIFILTLFAFEGKAYAQVSGSMTLVSDYSYRGISLSDGQAVPQLNLVYDSPDGWYAGAFGSKVRVYSWTSDGEQILLYSGLSRRLGLASGMIWEAGVTGSLFPNATSLNYGEIFTGIMMDNLSARIYYSPDYIGLSMKSLYLEANADYALHERIDVFSHIGWLTYPDAKAGQVANNRLDARIGFGVNFSSWKLQLAYGTTKQRHTYSAVRYQSPARSNLVFSASYLF
ncbi:TorF family putative porin [Undibacterium sp. Di26W]|uniref:TorF family putative porin n=1 Tax=Undibacterium sp. Di26W TaxID=3413035 RepID=UPI003BF1A6E3